MKLYKIKKSNIDRKGRGLYAVKDIKEGTRIIDYVGKIITKKQLSQNSRRIKYHIQHDCLPWIGAFQSVLNNIRNIHR